MEGKKIRTRTGTGNVGGLGNLSDKEGCSCEGQSGECLWKSVEKKKGPGRKGGGLSLRVR